MCIRDRSLDEDAQYQTSHIRRRSLSGFQTVSVYKRRKLEEGMTILETNGAPRVRKWATIEEIDPHIGEWEASFVLYALKNKPEFRRKFIYDCLPASCRELQQRSYAIEAANWVLGFSPESHRVMTESTVKEVVEKGVELARNYVLAEVTNEAVYCVKDASEILHGSVGDEELTEERTNELFDKVKPFIYGGTPMMRSLKQATDLFTDNNHEYKLLFVLSDGQPTDGNDPRAPLRDLADLGVTVICCYITCRPIDEPRRLYDTEQPEWEGDAKLMYRMSSSIPTQKIPRTLFVKQGWKIDIGKNSTRMFFQINHPDIIHEVCDVARDCVCKQDSLSDVLSSVSLDIYINKANEGLSPDRQTAKTCYAIASATVIHLAMMRIVGREGGYPDFYGIRDELITKHGMDGAVVEKVLGEACPKYRLQCKKTDERGALSAIVQKRPVVAIFRLSDDEWKAFYKFYQRNPRGILRKSTIDISRRQRGVVLRGHAVVLTSFDRESLRLMNSRGSDWADGGFFRVHKAGVLGLQFYDVFWSGEDLLPSEKNAYGRYGADISAKLMKSLTSLQTATYRCPLCSVESNVSEFRGHLLEAQCPRCGGTFNANVAESDLALNIYLTSLVSSDSNSNSNGNGDDDDDDDDDDDHDGGGGGGGLAAAFVERLLQLPRWRIP